MPAMEIYSASKCGDVVPTQTITYPRPSDAERAFDVLGQLLDVSLDLLFQDHVLGRLEIKEYESTDGSVTPEVQWISPYW